MHLDANRVFWAFITVAFAALLLLGILVVKALAHDWYPYECCGGYDCGPAQMETIASPTVFASLPAATTPFVTSVTVTYTSGPQMGKTETVVVPDQFPRRESKDGRTHACIVNGSLRCLFIPLAI